MASPTLHNITELPIELIATIATYLSPFDRINFSQACSLFDDVCSAQNIARYLDLRHCYKLSEAHLKHVTANNEHCLNIRVVNLNNCYWLQSKVLVQCIGRLKNLDELHLLECPIYSQLPKLLSGLRLVSLSFTANHIQKIDEHLSSWKALITSCLSGLKHLTISTSDILGLQLSLKYAATCAALESLNVLVHMVPTPREQSFSLEIDECVSPPSLKAIQVVNTFRKPLTTYQGVLLDLFCSSDNQWENILIDDKSGCNLLGLWIMQGKFSIDQFANLAAIHFDSMNEYNEIRQVVWIHVPIMLKQISLTTEMKCKELSLQYTSVPSLFLDLIAATCPRLEILNMNFTNIIGSNEDKQNHFQEICERCPHIKEMHLSGAICDDIFTPLSNLKNLRKLSFSLPSNGIHAPDNVSASSAVKPFSTKSRTGFRTHVTADEMQRSTIWKLTESCKRVEELEISSRDPCKDADLHCACISKWNTLRILSFVDIPSMIHGNFLTTIMRDCTALETLKLVNVGPTADCIYMRPLAEGLQLAHNLKDLRISNRKITLTCEFLESMSRCKTLERLRINDTYELDNHRFVNMVSKLHNLIFVRMVIKGTNKSCINLRRKLWRFKAERPAFFCMISHDEENDHKLINTCSEHHSKL